MCEIVQVFLFKARMMNTDYWISLFEEKLKTFHYSEATVDHYQRAVRNFLNSAGMKANHPEKIKLKSIEKYILDLIAGKHIGLTYQRQVVIGIAKFYELVLGVKLPIGFLKPRMPKSKLPLFISREEVKLMIDATGNLKHKCILCLLYSGGLRLKELVNLKVSDINSRQNTIQLAQISGGKSREIMLSQVLLENLRLYYKKYRPAVYLFEGQNGRQYSKRSVQQVVKQAAKKSNIGSEVSPHILRHSFAKHLLDNGTDIRFVKELLGHQSIKTTEIYNTIGHSSQSKIKSPLDMLLLN